MKTVVLMVFYTFGSVEECREAKEIIKTENKCVVMQDFIVDMPLPEERPEELENGDQKENN